MTSKDYEIEIQIMKLRERKRKRKFLLGLFAWCVFIGIVVNLIFGVRLVEGNSMRPAFLPGDLVIYRREPGSTLEYNDVVILDTRWDQCIIKRIVGKPGDVIEIDEKGHLVRNGEEIREPEVLFGYQEADSDVTYPYTVEEGHYFYLGDNRPVSLDSRIEGAAETKDVKGIVIGLIRCGSWNQKTR